MVEDFHLSQNASAVLRTAEGSGYSRHPHRRKRKQLQAQPGCHSRVQQVAHPAPVQCRGPQQHCLLVLRACGNRATSWWLPVPTKGHLPQKPCPSTTPSPCSWAANTKGLSDYALQYADYAVNIPMDGFLESFNVSVSAAVCLYLLTRRLKQQELAWHLSHDEKTHLRLDWLTMSSRSSEALIEQFLQGQRWT
jgi:tRNA (guanosine-2'-O-)-methyltransferase